MSAKTGLILSIGIAAGLAIASAGAAMAQEGGGGPPPIVFEPPPKKKQTAVQPSVKKPTATTRKSAVRGPRTARRQIIETAPSGQPPAGETRYLADQVIVRYQLSSRQSDLDALVGRLGLRHLEGRTAFLAGITVHRYAIANGASVSDTIAALESDPNVVYAQPNYLYELAQTTGKTGSAQYALDRLALHKALEVTRGGGIRVAVIDSAVDTAHPELAGASVDVVNVADDPAPQADAHGTSIAGIILSRATLTGVAPDAHLIAAVAFSAAGSNPARGNSWTVAKAMDAAWRAGAQVFNLSFAGPPDPLVENALKGADQRGIVAFAAAGNAGPNADPLYPAAYASTIAVTATDAQDAVYAKANGGDYVTIAAPGVDILAPAPGGAFGFSSGTSQATAHASGLAALALAMAPGLKPEQVKQLIAGSAKDLGAPGRDPVFGAGLPDAVILIESARSGG